MSSYEELLISKNKDISNKVFLNNSVIILGPDLALLVDLAAIQTVEEDLVSGGLHFAQSVCFFSLAVVVGLHAGICLDFFLPNHE